LVQNLTEYVTQVYQNCAWCNPRSFAQARVRPDDFLIQASVDNLSTLSSFVNKFTFCEDMVLECPAIYYWAECIEVVLWSFWSSINTCDSYVRSRSQLDFQNHIGFEAMREPSLMPSFPTQFGLHSARMRTRPTEFPRIRWLLSPSIPFQAGSQCPIAPPQGAGRTYCTEAASREAIVVDLDVRKDIRPASSSAVK
jgi:hypothetical protein